MRRQRLLAALAAAALLLALPPCTALAAQTRGDYADTLFDTAYVHTLDIVVPDGQWDAFIQSCERKEYMECDMVIDGERFESAAIRGKGNSSMQRSRSTGKYSFKVEFDHYSDRTYHGLDKLNLNNLVVDQSCVRDYMAYYIMAAAGVPAPLCSYIFVTVNGEDWGLYLAVEGLEDSFLRRNYGVYHGNLYKPDNLNNGGNRTTADVRLQYIDDDPASYPNIFGSAKTDPSRKDQYRLIESLKKLGAREDIPGAVDTEAVLRYFAVLSFICNGDSYTGSSLHNYYLYQAPDGRLSMLPWDFNEAFGTFGSGSMATAVNDPIDTPISSGTMDERPMLAWIFDDETYTARYHALLADLLDTLCDSGRLDAELAAVSGLIGEYVQRDPRSFVTYAQFETGVEDLALFLTLRAQSVRGQLDGTIPSTAAGQAEDSSSLVDATALGSMTAASGGPSAGPGGRR